MTHKKVFVTTGTQLAFPRLIQAMYLWASNHTHASVIAQTAAVPDNAQYDQQQATLSNMTTEGFLSPKRYKELVSWADVIVGHAGMGTIITGFEYQKPLVLMPRLFKLGEHRNDHQLATAAKFQDTLGITIVSNEQELIHSLNSMDTAQPAVQRTFESRDSLISNLQKYIKR